MICKFQVINRFFTMKWFLFFSYFPSLSDSEHLGSTHTHVFAHETFFQVQIAESFLSTIFWVYWVIDK